MVSLTTPAAVVAYEERGSGAPVVFLHGAGLTHRLWEPQIEVLGAHYRCVAVDLRGHGGSRGIAPGDEYRCDDLALDVVGLLDALGIDRAHIVGLSLGGLVAQLLALDHPGRVRTLVTMGAASSARPDPVQSLLTTVSGAYLLRRLRRPGAMEWVAKVGARSWTRVPETRAYMLADCAGNDPVEFARIWRGVMRYEVRARLHEIGVPLLAIAGARDRLRRQVRAGVKLMPHARYAEVAGAGHLTNRDAPGAVTELVAGWLAEHGDHGT
jgi:pimeloyl-ACP methyl ester carboxylesterase